MNKALLILLIFLMIGVANAEDIQVVNADVTWKSNATVTSQNLTRDMINVSERIVINNANILNKLLLIKSPQELTSNASLVGDRIVVRYANVIYRPILYVAPAELHNNAKNITERIVVRYNDVPLWNPELLLSGIEFVNIIGYTFKNATIRVPINTEVTWTNLDNVTHNITEDSGKFSSGNLKRNDSYTYKFKTAGVYYYRCKIHPSMKGTVIVTTTDKIPPASITYLTNTSYARNYIKWTWTDPKNTDFEKVLIYINGRYRTSVMKGIRYYNLTGLINNTIYNIGTHTVDTGGNINQTWKNNTARTAK